MKCLNLGQLTKVVRLKKKVNQQKSYVKKKGQLGLC